MKSVTFGSVSHGTLRNEDLLQAFASTLEGLILVNGDTLSMPENFSTRDKLNDLVHDAYEATEGDCESEQASDLVNELIDTISTFAPDYAYFGAHPGDASDFGFWPDIESVEMDGVEKGDELPDANSDGEFELGSHFAVVSDHGNMSLYCRNETGWTFLWSVV